MHSITFTVEVRMFLSMQASLKYIGVHHHSMDNKGLYVAIKLCVDQKNQIQKCL